MRRTFIGVAAAIFLALAGAARAQELLKEALSSFPRDTIRLEYSSPARLRALSSYSTLRQHYIGPRLQKLESSLADLGVHESDIDELLLGWQSAGGGLDLFGYATGKFNSKALRQSAATRGLAPSTVGGQQAYCLEAGLSGTCVLLLNDSRGVFGSLAVLTALMDARAGLAPALGADDRVARLAGDAAKSSAPIWGVAQGAAVPDWFHGWMPGQDSLQLDWAQAFQGVEALAYSVQVKDKVNLNVKLDCPTPEAALGLRQMLERVRLFQQLAWQNQNPSRPNPFEALSVDAKDREVELSLVTAYDAVASFGSTP